MDINEFHEQLQSDVIANSQGDGTAEGKSSRGEFRENSFTYLVCEELSAVGVLESPSICHAEGGSGSFEYKVNGYGIPDEDSRLDLFVTLYFSDVAVQRLNSADIDKAYRRLVRFLNAAMTPKFQDTLEPGSEFAAMVSEIHDRREEFDRVQLILLTNAVVSTRKESERKESLKDLRLSYVIWDLERLRRLRSSGQAQEPISVDLTDLVPGGIPCIQTADSTLGYQTCVAIFPGSVLHALYDEFGARLLELNVRSYLQARGKINKGILETLIREPHRFLAYNNGITVVAESIDLSPDGLHLTGINGMQIVNGGQTTASIHRAKKESSADLAHVYVQGKVTVVSGDDFEHMVPEISRFSNTQNKVNEVDLRANHPYHVGIERVSRRQFAPGEQSKWFYERARGSYQTQRAKEARTPAERQRFDRMYPTNQRFTKEDLARYVNAWDGYPHIVSRGGQKNFLRFMESVPIAGKGWEPPLQEFKQIIGKAILYRQAQTLARELGISSFRVNIVTYTVALVAELAARRIDLERIWDAQSISEPLSNLIKGWLKMVETVLVDSVEGRNPTEWFKLEDCWKNLRDKARSWDMPDGVKKELVKIGNTSAENSSGAGVHDLENNIARCVAIPAETWFKIQVWGGETHKLLAWQIGIANTLAGYAAGGWQRKPSEKQAKHGVKILEIAEEVWR
ncbi:MAG: AIPR family protein [Betaproteobacteria bacterium]|jgi:hypothetical protein